LVHHRSGKAAVALTSGLYRYYRDVAGVGARRAGRTVEPRDL